MLPVNNIGWVYWGAGKNIGVYAKKYVVHDSSLTQLHASTDKVLGVFTYPDSKAHDGKWCHLGKDLE